MGSTNESLDLRKTFNYTGNYSPFSPSPFQLPTPTLSHSSHSDPTQIESNANLNNSNYNNNDKSSLEAISYHQRCSSESFLMEEQPSWLDDLLNETETSVNDLQRGHHRRSASDSYAYFGEAEDKFTLEDESKYVNSLFGTSSMRLQNLMHGTNNSNNQESEEGISSLVVEHRNNESADKASCGSQVKPSGGSKAESKRSKQHNAHRSRVRKLQYIAHLERTVQLLMAEGSGVSAEQEFLEQQNIILTMENRALRQRLESISQEQMIKNWEQGMLEREIGRLQSLYHMQKQQQIMQQNQPHNNHPKHRRNKSLDHQMNGAHPKINNYKDALSSKGSINGSFRV
ncbi:hypothetical protein CASFOL_016398 [Castilleja foliolosa]|uniref:BZIP domain-containing protein n=1 Tax=Castilleja foliolosa TaxID=1961234 RepID=A0ABD3DGH1_9LAMI